MVLPLALAVLGAAKLTLTGEQSSIRFGNHAIVSATCGADAPSVKGVSPRQTDGWPVGNATVELLVAPSCISLASDVPCAAHATLTTPPLFWCRFKSSEGEHAVGPLNAQREAIEENGVFYGVAVLLACPWPEVATLRSITAFTLANGGKDGLVTIEVLHGTTPQSASVLPFRGLEGEDATVRLLNLPAQPPPSPPPSTPSPSAPGSGCSAASSTSCESFRSSGMQTFTPPGATSAISVYCDLDSAGGPWALVEVGTNVGTNLRTADAVGSTPMPLDQGASESAKLSRADQVALYTATGKMVGLKWGTSCAYIYARDLPDSCISEGGCGGSPTPEWGANRVAESLGGQWSNAGSEFAWPASKMPSGCSNINGATGECSSGCHIGGQWTNTLDGAWTNHCPSCGGAATRKYEVWVRSTDPTRVYRSCGDAKHSGAHVLQPSGATSAISVYCDLDSAGGPWALVEVGTNVGTNLRTADAVGSTPMPLDQGASESAKLSRADQVALYTATGKMVGLKWGTSCAYIYARDLPDSCISEGGCGGSPTPEWGANRVAESLGGQWSNAGSEFAWPASKMPSGCSNINGATGECSSGCHIGGQWTNTLDGAWTNHCPSCGGAATRKYEVWVRSGD